MTLVEFLLARVAEDEQAAQAALLGFPWAPAETTERSTLTSAWVARYHEVVQRRVEEPSAEFVARHRPGWDLREEIVADCGPANVYPAQHIASWDPARVLAECQARRAIIELHEHVGSFLSEWQDGDPVPFESGQFGCRICALDDRQIEPEGWCATLRALAGPFKGHPDFDAGWLPK